MLICLAVTCTSSSIALLFFLSPTLCLFQSPLLLCPLLPSASLPRWRGCAPINSVRPKTSRPLSQWLSNYLPHRGEMESHSSHFNQSVCVRVSLCQCGFECESVIASVPAEAIRWSWCLRERKAGRMAEWNRREGSLSSTWYRQFLQQSAVGWTACV